MQNKNLSFIPNKFVGTLATKKKWIVIENSVVKNVLGNSFVWCYLANFLNFLRCSLITVSTKPVSCGTQRKSRTLYTFHEHWCKIAQYRTRCKKYSLTGIQIHHRNIFPNRIYLLRSLLLAKVETVPHRTRSRERERTQEFFEVSCEMLCFAATKIESRLNKKILLSIGVVRKVHFVPWRSLDCNNF